MLENIEKSLNNAYLLLKEFINEESNLIKIEQVSEKIAAAFSVGKKVLICGNGGSAADAIHFAEEFTGKYDKDRKALPVIALTDPAHITCVGNDYGFDKIFARGIEAYGNLGDIFVGISTSGNSENILNALEKSKQLGLQTVCFLGKSGGVLKDKADYQIIFPGKNTARIQELHMLVLHIIIESVEQILFPEIYKK
ncbi:MAG: SIS domain-containing protein [Candidatus Cloacimonadota bacterium]|nr:SIS domain-containing protein [Candidatus Cloacimonadota bacterium]